MPLPQLYVISCTYIQQYSGVNNKIIDSIILKFIFITEHISFISNQIIHGCYCIFIESDRTLLLPKLNFLYLEKNEKLYLKKLVKKLFLNKKLQI